MLTPLGKNTKHRGVTTPRPNVRPYVNERFELRTSSVERLRGRGVHFGFGGFGEVAYYNAYSRRQRDGTQEHWADTNLRVINGVFSVRKDYYKTHGLPWDEGRWQEIAEQAALSMHEMEWLPPGRGLFAMGTDYIYKRGSMALFNCGASSVGVKTFAEDLGWIMDALMCGVGVGIECLPLCYELTEPSGEPAIFDVPDSREGWVDSVIVLLESFLGGPPVKFCYDGVRPKGVPLKGIGGLASGPEPLERLHAHIRMTCARYCRREFGGSRLVADLANGIGCCVVMGNIRRSAEILIGSPWDQEFLDLKNYDKYPERAAWGWMSNNSVRLVEPRDFELMPQIAARIKRNGEPGFINQAAMSKFARFGREVPDAATLFNPCGEIPLESKELCNLSEVFPTRCVLEKDFLCAARFATLYSSTVALLPTHRPETNRIMARNRRIGVSVSGVAEWIDSIGAARMTRLLRDGYQVVRGENARLASEAGVPVSIRVTTIKPSGTISQLAGVPPGVHFPTFEYAIRRIRIATNSPLAPVLAEAGYPWAFDNDDELKNTLVFEFPIDQGSARKATEVSVWEQAAQLCTMQREWADNAVSVTLYFDPEKEAGQLEYLLAQIAPMVKSVSALPHTPEGVYAQAPYSEISLDEYLDRKKALKPINWSTFRSEGNDEKYCNNATCTI